MTIIIQRVILIVGAMMMIGYDCQQISYSKYKVESEKITIQCKICHEITRS
jgi:hypothetical protein